MRVCTSVSRVHASSLTTTTLSTHPSPLARVSTAFDPSPALSRRPAPSPPFSADRLSPHSRVASSRTYAPITRINHPRRFIRINLRPSRAQPVSSHPPGLVRHRAQSQSSNQSKTSTRERPDGGCGETRDSRSSARDAATQIPARFPASTPASLDHGRRRRDATTSSSAGSLRAPIILSINRVRRRANPRPGAQPDCLRVRLDSTRCDSIDAIDSILAIDRSIESNRLDRLETRWDDRDERDDSSEGANARARGWETEAR